jgi:hypothetical protein
MAKKPKSTVNAAGNYTKPTMRKAIFNSVKAGGMEMAHRGLAIRRAREKGGSV